MPLNADISTALQLLEHIQHTIDVSDDAKLQAQTNDDLNLLISVLENPILRGIVSVQVSTVQVVYCAECRIASHVICITKLNLQNEGRREIHKLSKR